MWVCFLGLFVHAVLFSRSLCSCGSVFKVSLFMRVCFQGLFVDAGLFSRSLCWCGSVFKVSLLMRVCLIVESASVCACATCAPLFPTKVQKNSAHRSLSRSLFRNISFPYIWVLFQRDWEIWKERYEKTPKYKDRMCFEKETLCRFICLSLFYRCRRQRVRMSACTFISNKCQKRPRCTSLLKVPSFHLSRSLFIHLGVVYNWMRQSVRMRSSRTSISNIHQKRPTHRSLFAVFFSIYLFFIHLGHFSCVLVFFTVEGASVCAWARCAAVFLPACVWILAPGVGWR